MIVTSLSFVLSYTRVRDLESVGSESVSSVMLFMLIAIMGLQMDITAISDFPDFCDRLYLAAISCCVCDGGRSNDKSPNCLYGHRESM